MRAWICITGKVDTAEGSQVAAPIYRLILGQSLKMLVALQRHQMICSGLGWFRQELWTVLSALCPTLSEPEAGGRGAVD